MRNQSPVTDTQDHPDYLQQKPQSTSAGFLLLAFVLMLVGIIAVLMPVEPSDYWPYLRIGQEILKNHALPTTEFMSYTSYGQPATYSYWLASLLFLGIFNLGELPLTVLVTGLCIAAFYVLLWFCLKELKAGAVSSSLILLIVALMGSHSWSTRPQVFAYPLFALLLLILLKWQKGHNRLLCLLPVMMLLWVNLHGSYLLAFLLVGSALIFGRGSRKKLLIFAVLTLLVTLANPYGLGIWTNTSGMIGNDLIKTFSSEWFPPANEGWQLNLFFLSLLLVPVFTAFSSAKGSRLLWVWFLGFGWMALSSVRYVIWFSAVEGLLLIEILLPWLSRALDERFSLRNKTFNILLGVLLLAFSLAFLPGLRGAWWPDAPDVVTDTTPVEAVAWLNDHPELEGELWSNWVASIYETYALPGRKVWVTNRIEDFTEQQFLDSKSLMRASYNWQQILDSYDVKTLLLSQKYDVKLLNAVESSAQWHEVYRDEQSVIFTR